MLGEVGGVTSFHGVLGRAPGARERRSKGQGRVRVTRVTSVPETTSCRPALHQGALGPPPPAPRHSQAQEHTQTCAHTHTHARHAPGNACRRLRRDWLEGKRCARQRPLPLLDPGVSQGLGLEVKRDRDGAGETSCSPGLSWREGPGGIRGNCPAGLPAPLPSGGGASGPPVCVCVGGCRTTLLGWRERGRPAPDWPPPAPSRALGGGGPCLRTCFQAGVGGSSRSPSVPPSLLSPRSVQDPAGCQGGPPPTPASTRPPRCVRTRARWGCVPGAGGGSRGSGSTFPGPGKSASTGVWPNGP